MSRHLPPLICMRAAGIFAVLLLVQACASSGTKPPRTLQVGSREVFLEIHYDASRSRSFDSGDSLTHGILLALKEKGFVVHLSRDFLKGELVLTRRGDAQVRPGYVSEGTSYLQACLSKGTLRPTSKFVGEMPWNVLSTMDNLRLRDHADGLPTVAIHLSWSAGPLFTDGSSNHKSHFPSGRLRVIRADGSAPQELPIPQLVYTKYSSYQDFALGAGVIIHKYLAAALKP